MTEVTKTGHTWPMETKLEFVQHYFLTGVLAKTADELGIPYDTAKLWKRQEWFAEHLTRITEEANKATDRTITRLIEKGFQEMEDRIVNGEERVTKDGSVVKVKANLSSLTMATGTLFDKRQILRKAPGSQDAQEDVLARLAEKLREFSKAPPRSVEDAVDVEVREVVSNDDPD